MTIRFLRIPPSVVSDLYFVLSTAIYRPALFWPHSVRHDHWGVEKEGGLFALCCG